MSGTVRARLLALPFLLACGSGSTSAPAAIRVTPGEPRLVIGATVQLAAEALDEAGQPLPDVELRWRSSSEGVATVSAGGLVTAVAVGVATITVEGGGASGEARAGVREGAIVGAAGARVTALGGAAVLDIPAGALAAPTAVAVYRAGALLDARLAGDGAVGIDVEGGFAVAATLEVTYDAGKIPPGAGSGLMRLATRAGDGWTEVGGADDVGRQRVRAPITAAGIYAARLGSPGTPCSAPGYRAFDFWVGRWEVNAATMPGVLSDITADADGCYVNEYFRGDGLNGYVGRSVSFYRPASDEWFQTYVDNQRGRLDMVGSFKDGKMTMQSSGGAQGLDRYLWEPLSGGRVHQHGEHSGDGGATWIETFDGVYTRAP